MDDNGGEGRAQWPAGLGRTVDIGAFVVVLLFVWLVFDNFALGLLFALMLGGGAAAARRAGRRKDD